MNSSARTAIVSGTETVVVKIGTSVLTQPNDRIDLNRIHALAEQFAAVRASGRQLVVVSSGAIGAGMGRLGLNTRPVDLPHLQAAAATGQAWLIRSYEDNLREFGHHVAQILLTANDFRQRGRYLNVRNTLRTLFEYGVIPIVNENDSVSIDEIRFGDNDHLASMLSAMLPGALLVVLTTADGLHEGGLQGPVVPLVDGWHDRLLEMAETELTARGSGGMRSKLLAIRDALSSGVHAVIANGRRDDVLPAILEGGDVGTWFRANADERSLPAWKRWIGFTVRPAGRLALDEGACRAIQERGSSLLPVGIREVSGDFRQGETVALTNTAGDEIARGLSNYSSEDVRRIAGRRSSQIAEVLGGLSYEEVVHRDNMVLSPHGS